MLLVDKAKEIASKLKNNGRPVKLIIVDSLTAHFRAEYVGRGSLADRQQKLNRHLHDLMKFGEIFNAAIVVTNQVMASPIPTSSIPLPQLVDMLLHTRQLSEFI